MLIDLFYQIKPIVPRKIQLMLRRRIAKNKRIMHKNTWPIDPSAGNPPAGWAGWPDGKKFALVLSHDVDTQKGHDAIPLLIDIEKQFGLKSAFNIVPERYKVSQKMIDYIKEQGLELNAHGLKHDGKLFKSKKIFSYRAKKINKYLKKWGSTGFTAPSMICNLQWLHDLNIDHSTCTFDIDPFEPQPTPSKTIFPFLVKSPDKNHVYVEIPYTLPQDHALFIILQEKDISIWKEKLDWIVSNSGMALLNTHPDYMQFDVSRKNALEEYNVNHYSEFLIYIKEKYEGKFWNALPSEVATHVRKMMLNNV